MPVNNYLRECKYNLNNLDNYIYLYEFNEPLLDYITDDGESNASASNIKGSAQRLYCESVEYSSTSSVDNRFSFDNTLTVTLAEHSKVSHYSIIQTLLNNNWMVVFKNKENEAFVVNAEYPVMVSYSYVINDEKTPNILTITFRALQNAPTVYLKTSVAFSLTLCDKPCEYVISRIKSLKMIDMDKATIDVDGYGFTLNEKGGGNLKTIEFNPTSMSFTDSFDGREFSQTLSFQIPFISYRFYFHYNLLEYLNNRYYALIETTNNNNILSGFRQGLFPSYTVSTNDSGNLITINLNAKYTTYSVLGSDTMNITTNDSVYYKPISGECVNNFFTWTLLEQYNSNGLTTNDFYCLSGFEDVYNNYNIVGTYKQFDTKFGFNIVDYNIKCSEDCKINNLPSSIQFQQRGQKKCFTIDNTCPVEWEWDSTAFDFTFDNSTKEMCVTSKVDNGTFSIKATSIDGTTQYVTVIIGDGGGGITGDTTTRIDITAQGQKINIIPIKGLSNVKSVTSSLQYASNQNGNGYEVTVPENTNEEPRTFTITILYKDNSIETINVIQGRIYYVTTTTEDTACIGQDLYYINKKYKKYTENGELIFVGNIRGNQKETNSIACLDYDEKVNSCTSCFEGFIYTLCEYKKNGSTILTRYEKTTSSCTNNATTEYVVNNEKAVCVDGTEYYIEELYGVNCNGGDNVKLYPIIERTSTTEAINSNVCDVINPNVSGETLYRWIDTNETYCLTDTSQTNCTSSKTETYCDGYNLYERTTYYVDALCNGNWSTSGSPTNILLETNSTRCGYEEPTCNPSTTNVDYELLTIKVIDEKGNELGTFNADENNTINTNLTVKWNKSVIIDECSYTYNTVVINEDCTSSTTQNTGTTFTTSISSNENESTENQEAVTITIKSGYTTIGDVIFYRKPMTGVTLTYAYNGNASNSIFYLNENDYTAQEYGVYTTTLKELGIKDLTSCYKTFKESNITNLISFPDTSEVTTMRAMFQFCTGLTSLDLSSFNTISVRNMEFMFYGCSGLTSLDLSSFNTSNVTSMMCMFDDSYNLNSIVLSSFDTSNVYNMDRMFYRCSGLTSLDLSNFDTSNVLYMEDMFSYCNSLTSLDLSNFNTSNVENMMSMFAYCDGLTTLDLSSFDTSKVTTMKNMFNYCTNLTSLNLLSFDTSNVTSMENMFYNCSGLTSLDLSNFDTSNITTMEGMFHGCSGLTSLDLSNFNTSKFPLLSWMFYNCTSLQTLNVTNWDVSEYVIDKYKPTNMFENCSSLTKLIIGEVTQEAYNWWCERLSDAGIYCDIIEGSVIGDIGDTLSFEFSGNTATYKLNEIQYTATTSPYSTTLAKLNINNLTNCIKTFESSSITNLISFPDTSEVTVMLSMFAYCDGLTSLDLSSFNTSNVVNMYNMFNYCTSLTSLNVSSFDTSNVTTMESMFYYCSGLTSLDLSSFDTSNVTDMDYMFSYCSNLTTLDVSSWDVNHITYNAEMFKGCNSLNTLKVKEGTYDWWCERLNDAEISCDIIEGDEPDTPINDTLSFEFSGYTAPYILNGRNYTATTSPYTTTLRELSIEDLTSCYRTFSGSSITNLISFPDTSNVTSMEEMFSYCKRLTSLDLSNFNTSNVTTMEDMFSYCSGLTSLNVSSFDTSNVTTMENMFYRCSGLTELDLSSFNTSGVTTMEDMFSGCTSLTSLDVSSFDTSNVTTMYNIFNGCSSLTSINLSSFNTSKVTTMENMFYGCSGLTSLDLSSFDTSKVTSIGYMFLDCSNLTTLDVSSWGVNHITFFRSMFANCTSLQTLRIKEGTYDWWCARLTEAEISCDIIEGDEPDMTKYTLSFEFSGDTYTYRLNEIAYTATTSPYTITLTELGITGLTNCTSAFTKPNITTLTSFPDTSNVYNMGSMFSGCTSLTSLNVSNFNTSNVTNMSAMFSNCKSLTSLDLSSFDTSNVESMYEMFYNCSGLTSLDLSSFNISNVFTMSNMFSYCKSLTSLNVSSFNTSNVTYKSNMFNGCTNLQTLKVKQGTRDWWYARLTENSIQNNVTIIEV
ncbi:BspA family leucine-rich repeat surface protein [Methanobrevibacter sp.]|uniref:BspA family leucine-rich repeat surface protein n=1 Tax=Methanobrevibacter sp. TaxID=66852 RepID=UPI0038900FE6